MTCLSLHFDVRPSTSTKSAKTTLKIFHPYLLFASVSLPSTANTPFSTMILHDCRKNRTFFSMSHTPVAGNRYLTLPQSPCMVLRAYAKTLQKQFFDIDDQGELLVFDVTFVPQCRNALPYPVQRHLLAEKFQECIFLSE